MFMRYFKFFTITILVVLPSTTIAQNWLAQVDDVAFSQIQEVRFEGLIQNVVWQPDGNLLLVSGENGVYILNSRFERINHHTFDENSFIILSVWSPDGNKVASLLQSGNVIVWRDSDGAILDSWSVRGVPLSMAWSPDGVKIAVGSDYGFGILTVYDTNTQLHHESLIGDSSENTFGGINTISWHPNGHWVVIGVNPEPAAIVWDTISNEQIDRIRVSKRVLVTLDPEGTLITLAGIQDSSSFDDISPQPIIYIWPIGSPDPEKTILMDVFGDFDFGAIAWQPQGNFLATYNFDNQIRVWNSENWQLAAQLPGIKRNRDIPSQNSLAWSPNGTTLIDVGENILRVWHLEEN